MSKSFIACVSGWWINWASPVVFWRRSREKQQARKSFKACLAGGITGRILAAEMREDWEQVGKELNFI